MSSIILATSSFDPTLLISLSPSPTSFSILVEDLVTLSTALISLNSLLICNILSLSSLTNSGSLPLISFSICVFSNIKSKAFFLPVSLKF
jgi:hypothetical protein